jgi:hypothetical protein
MVPSYIVRKVPIPNTSYVVTGELGVRGLELVEMQSAH